MKIGVVGLGNRIAHVFHELKRINSEAELVAYADPQPIGQAYACLLYTSSEPTRPY